MVRKLCFILLLQSWVCTAAHGLEPGLVFRLAAGKGAKASGCVWDIFPGFEKDCACGIGGKGKE
jgi:hypothetical protein